MSSAGGTRFTLLMMFLLPQSIVLSLIFWKLFNDFSISVYYSNAKQTYAHHLIKFFYIKFQQKALIQTHPQFSTITLLILRRFLSASAKMANGTVADKFSKLPELAKPSLYEIHLAPCLKTFTVKGSEKIHLNVNLLTKSLKLTYMTLYKTDNETDQLFETSFQS
jgi:hypothetical protein